MEGDDGFGRRWLIHWITAILFSVVFFFLSKWLEPPLVLRALDRAGSDAVIRGYAPEIDPRRDPRIVVVDLGAEPTAQNVGEMLDLAAKASRPPKAIGLDLIFVKDLQENRSKSGANPVDELAAKLEDARLQNTLIAMDVRTNQQLEKKLENEKLTEIRPASILLGRDEDGVVRSVCPEEIPRDRIPTLAEAMLDKRWTGCGPHHDPAILFAPVRVPEADDKREVFLVTQEAVAIHKDILNDSYVLLGVAARGVGSDRYLTPVGENPGVMIHAQSLWTLWHDSTNSWERHREFIASLLNLLTAFVAGGVFSLYPAWKHGRERPIDSIRQTLHQFAEGLVLLALIALVLVVLGVTWTWLAVGLLSAGVVIGAMSAMFGAMLETLVHAGEYLVKPLHWLVEQSMKRKTATVALAIIRFRSSVALTDRADDEV